MGDVSLIDSELVGEGISVSVVSSRDCVNACVFNVYTLNL